MPNCLVSGLEVCTCVYLSVCVTVTSDRVYAVATAVAIVCYVL